MELMLQHLKKGMIVKVVFYHSRMPESFYTKELGIVQDIDVHANVITIQMLTQGFHSDKYVCQTEFFITPNKRYLVTNNDIYGFRKFCRIESCDPKELKSAESHLQNHYQKELQQLRHIRATLRFLGDLIKKLEGTTSPEFRRGFFTSTHRGKIIIYQKIKNGCISHKKQCKKMTILSFASILISLCFVILLYHF